MKNQLFFASLLAASAFCSTGLQAGPIEDLAAQIKADEAYVRTHPDNGQLAAQHNEAMRIDMERRDLALRAENAANRKIFQAQALAAVRYWSATQPERIPNRVTADNHGNVTKTYDNENPLGNTSSTAEQALQRYFKLFDSGK